MTAEGIRSRFEELGHKIPLLDISNRIEELTGRFHVPNAEAERSVVSYFLRQLGVVRSEYYSGAATQNMSIADLPHEDGKWTTLRVKLTDIWDAPSEHITQAGIVGDGTGKVKFVIWKKSGLPEMEIGMSYTLENVVTSLYNDKVSITLNKTSKIIEIDDDIEVGDTTSEYTGALVSIKNGSGLIRRCPTCNRALRSGVCQEHGSVDGKYDLRILGVLDDGTSTQDILLGLDETVALWGTTLDDAKTTAVDALDAAVVVDKMRTDLVGRYYTVSGSDMGDMMLVKECEVIA